MVTLGLVLAGFHLALGRLSALLWSVGAARRPVRVGGLAAALWAEVGGSVTRAGWVVGHAFAPCRLRSPAPPRGGRVCCSGRPAGYGLRPLPAGRDVHLRSVV